MKNPILIVDDDRDYTEILKRNLADAGFITIQTLDDPFDAASLFENGAQFDAAIIDYTMPGLTGLELIDIIKRHSPETECIMVTAVNEVRAAVDCLRRGAYDYLVKPVLQEDLILSINRALEKKRLLDILDIRKSHGLPELSNPKPFKSIITGSSKVLRVLKEAELHAASDVPILITGESGTGKELLARAIHMASPRSAYRFTPINMASITSSLFESEFFGHMKGAFTGADRIREGYLEHTHKGTIFLDEIGDLSIDQQGKLLRVLQDGEYLKLGTSRLQKVDVRYIAATNADIEKLIARKSFRKDLYYRIRGGWLHLPPLRERKEDIPLLIKKFIKEFFKGSGQIHFDDSAMSVLMDYQYPGNIRELRSIIQSSLNLSKNNIVSASVLPDHLRKQKPVSGMERKKYEAICPLEVIEKEHILKAYEFTGRNKSETARILNIGLNTLRRKLKSYEM